MVLTDYLCYHELHVADKTYYIHYLVEANSEEEAWNKMPKTIHAKNHTFQRKGMLGEFDINKHKKYLMSIGGGIRLE